MEALDKADRSWVVLIEVKDLMPQTKVGTLVNIYISGYSQYSVPPTPIPFRRSVPDLSGQDDESLLRRVAADAEMIGDVYVREAVAFDDDFDIYAREAEIDESLDFEYSF